MAVELEDSINPDRWDLVTPHRPRLLAIAHARCENPADAEDCVQEAMLRVAAYPKLDVNRVGQLLTTVVIRLAVDTYRLRARNVRVAHKLVVPTSTAGCDAIVCDRAEAEWLAGHVESLPAIQRDVMLARANGQSWDSIALELGTSFKTVESAASRARASLRARWAATTVVLGLLARRLRSVGPAEMTAALAATTIAFSTVGPLVRGEATLVRPNEHRATISAIDVNDGSQMISGEPSAQQLALRVDRAVPRSRMANQRDVARVEAAGERVVITQEPTEDPSLLRRLLVCDYSLSIEPGTVNRPPSIDGRCQEEQQK